MAIYAAEQIRITIIGSSNKHLIQNMGFHVDLVGHLRSSIYMSWSLSLHDPYQIH